MIKIISEAKISFNKNLSCDINYRTFETIGLGTCLATDYNEDLSSLGFIDEKNCILYKNYNECVDKINNAIKNNLCE